MKKVLILTHYDPSSNSGGDIVRSKRIAQLLSVRYEVRVFGFHGYSPNINLAGVIKFIPSWLSSLIRVIFSDKFEWLYIVNDSYLVTLSHFLKKISLRKYKIAFDICLTSRLLRRKGVGAIVKHFFEQLALLFSELIITTSKKGKAMLKSFEKKVLVIPNFVDTESFKKDVEKGIKIRKKYGISSESKVVGLVGPFNNIYNRPFLKFLRENYQRFDKRIKFLIIGRYDSQDFFKRENVIWAGCVEDYIAHLSALDCLLIPRTVPTEGAMNKALEAMSMGIPVFTTPTGHLNLENLIPNENLFVFPEEELPSTINRLLFDNELMTKVGQSARSQVEQFYSMEAVKRRLLQRLELTFKEA